MRRLSATATRSSSTTTAAATAGLVNNRSNSVGFVKSPVPGPSIKSSAGSGTGAGNTLAALQRSTTNTTAGTINPGFIGLIGKQLKGGEILFFNALEEWEINAGSGGGGDFTNDDEIDES